MRNLYNFINRNKGLIILCLVVVLVLFCSTDMFARLGGGGGSSRSSSGGGGDADGLIGILIAVFTLIPFPFNIIVAAVVIVGYIFFKRKSKQSTVLNKLPGGDFMKTGEAKGYADFKSKNPGFDEAKFIEKVKKAFYDLQYAWQDQDMSKVRRYISDGMFQRLNTQFKMMSLLAQKNTIDKLNIKNVRIDKVETDGLFDIIHVAIHASIVDKFISEKYKKLNSGGSEEFIEYWSFLKKRGKEEKDMYSTDNCPNCGGELPKTATEVAKCEFCGSITNSGEYDWVLSEITQSDDYVSKNPAVTVDSKLSTAVRQMVADNEDFAVQLVEDKASNGYLQIETARVFKDPKLLRRFVSNEAFDKLSKRIEAEPKFVYNRLFLNDVSLVAAMQKDNKNMLMISVKKSYQRVQPEGDKVEILDPVVTSMTDVIVMSRDKDAGKSKGSLYAHNCPSCGGPVGDTMDTKCEYCGSELNSTKNEWIITDIMTISEYNAFYAENQAAFAAKVDPSKIDGLYKVRDFAFNNLLILVAADGKFDEEERQFTEKMAKKWGYNLNKIQPMFQMAQNRQLVIRMPDKAKEQAKILKMMEKAASVDGSISPEEQQLLDAIKTNYNISASSAEYMQAPDMDDVAEMTDLPETPEMPEPPETPEKPDDPMDFLK